MEQRISLVTLGVGDLARAKAFYERLGWHGQTVEETVFVQAGAMALVLWGRDKLAAECGLQSGPPAGFGGTVLAQNVRSTGEVDEIVATASAAGATVTRPPCETFYGGYAGVFTDPDGHAWEIAYNPSSALAEDGTLTIPDFSARSVQAEPSPARRGGRLRRSRPRRECPVCLIAIAASSSAVPSGARVR